MFTSHRYIKLGSSIMLTFTFENESISHNLTFAFNVNVFIQLGVKLIHILILQVQDYYFWLLTNELV